MKTISQHLVLPAVGDVSLEWLKLKVKDVEDARPVPSVSLLVDLVLRKGGQRLPARSSEDVEDAGGGVEVDKALVSVSE